MRLEFPAGAESLFAGRPMCTSIFMEQPQTHWRCCCLGPRGRPVVDKTGLTGIYDMPLDMG